MSIPLDQEIRILRSLFWSDRDPDGRAFVPLADAYRRSGSFRQAVELLNEGIERHPDFASAHAVAARLYLEKGLVEEAEIAARKVVALDEDNVLGLELLAGALERRGVTEEAASVRSHLAALSGTRSAPPARVGEPVEEPAEEPVADIATLAPEGAGEEVMDLAALAPDEAVEEEDEVVMELAALAPDEAVDEEEVMDLAALAPDEAVEEEDEVVMELAALAPDEAVDEEEVMDLAALAPDEAVEEEEEVVMELAALAPDEAVDEEEVMDLAALAPDEAVEEEEEVVMDLAALAPDEAVAEEEVMDLAALAPDEAVEEEEEVVMDLAALAPDEAVEEEEEVVMDLAALAPDAEAEPEEEPLELAALAPDEAPDDEVLDEAVMDLAALAPDVTLHAAPDTPDLFPDEALLDRDELAPSPGWFSHEDSGIVIFASDAGVSAADVLPDDPLPSDELTEEPRLVTRTMAELYARQGFTDRALETFRQLLEATPGDPGLRRRIAELEAAEALEEAAARAAAPPPGFDEDEGVTGHAWDAEAQQALHEVDTPFAWTEEDTEEEAAGPAIGAYFERLLAWEPGGGDWDDEEGEVDAESDGAGPDGPEV